MPWKDPGKKRRRRKELYHERRSRLLALLGGQCSSCGSQENLQFDHVDPSNKSFTIAKALAAAVPMDTIEQELEKCQLLCYDCHREKNKADNGEAAHGSLTMYSHHRCRCSECKQAWRAYHRIRKQKKSRRA